MMAAIIIPALNEADTVADVVQRVHAYGTPIVVNDGSSDSTATRAEAAGAIVVQHEFNRGYDAALASGFERAMSIGARLIVTIDADGQLDSTAIPSVLEALADRGAKLVIGVRSGGAARFSEALFNLYSRLRFGVPDILCGLKGFRADTYAALCRRAARDSVHTALALALLRNGESFALIPVAVQPRQGSPRYGGAWRANVRILRALGGAIIDDVLKR